MCVCVRACVRVCVYVCMSIAFKQGFTKFPFKVSKLEHMQKQLFAVHNAYDFVLYFLNA